MFVLLTTVAVVLRVYRVTGWLQASPELPANVCVAEQPVFDWLPSTEFEMGSTVFLLEEKIVYSDYPFDFSVALEKVCSPIGLDCQFAFGWPNNTMPDWLISDGLRLYGTPKNCCQLGGPGYCALRLRVELVVRNSHGKTLRRYLLPVLCEESRYTVWTSLYGMVKLFQLIGYSVCGIILLKSY